MKTNLKVLAMLGLSLLVALSSCKEGPEPEPEPGPDPVYADVPFSKITVTCDGETAEGKIVDTKYIQFHFTSAESFNDAKMAVTVNEGYELTYPTSMEHIDLQAEPVVNFKDPKNATIKYFLRFSSDAFPIVDESKIHLEGMAAGESLTIDNASKTFIVKYDKDKIDYNEVTIVFEEGALQEGASVTTPLTYDFTDGLEQPLVIDLNGDRIYTVALDVTAYVNMSPAEFGFQDETYKYVDNVDNYPFLKVWRANMLPGIPTYSTETAWVQANPYEWDYSWAYDEGADWGGYHYDWTDAFSFLGNWAEDRPTMKCIGPVVIVTIDQEDVKAAMVTNESYSMKLGDVNAFITVPGYSDNMSNWYYMLFANGTVRANPEGALYRSAIGVTADGKLSFATACASNGDNVVKQVPFQTGHDASQDAVAASAVAWDVESAAWALPWILRDGEAMTWQDIWNNDAARWSESFGQGWNSAYPCHVVVGVTYDNKIGIICNPGGSDNWDGGDTNDNPVINADGGYFKGITPNQMAWIAKKLGWRELIVVSGQNGEGTGNASTVRINGKSVFSQADHPYGAEVYNNEAADVNCAYVLSFDRR